MRFNPRFCAVIIIDVIFSVIVGAIVFFITRNSFYAWVSVLIAYVVLLLLLSIGTNPSDL